MFTVKMKAASLSHLDYGLVRLLFMFLNIYWTVVGKDSALTQCVDNVNTAEINVWSLIFTGREDKEKEEHSLWDFPCGSQLLSG